MKKLIFILLALTVLTMVGVNPVFAQNNLVDRIGTKSDERVDQAIDNGFDKLEQGIGNLFGKNKKSQEESVVDEKVEESPVVQQQEDNMTNTGENNTENIRIATNTNKEPALIWSKYDFIPGDEVIFEDNLVNEENGEFPSRWDMMTGGVENAIFEGENVIMFLSGTSRIVPYLKNPEQDYLPEIFTIEFDAYFAEGAQNRYHVNFHT